MLASRWGHRQSFDVDLFCDPTVYGGLTRRERSRIEDRIAGIPDCTRDRTWCEDIATYTEIGDIEAAVMPSSVVLEPSAPTRLAGTTLRLQGSAQILYAKIAWRMYQAGETTVRDAYDVVAASIHEPAALARACAHTSPRVLATVSSVIGALPRGWSGNDMKALVEPAAPLVRRLLAETGVGGSSATTHLAWERGGGREHDLDVEITAEASPR